MHRLIFFKIAIVVVIQHILAVCAQRPKATNPCPSDFLRIHNRCYYFSSQDDTFEGATRKCGDRNSTLAVITTKNQKNVLREFLKKGYLDANLPPSSRLQTVAPRWLGGQCDWNALEWKWIYDGKVIRHNLYDKERLQKDKEWQCLTIDPNVDYSWNSDSCFNKNYYICQTKLLYQKKSNNANNNRIKAELVPHNLRTNSTVQHVSDIQPGFYLVTAENSVPSKGNERKKKKPKKKFICPKNFILVRKKCYHFSRDKATWPDAFYKCQDANSELAILKTMQQDKRLRFQVNKFHLTNTLSWIGGQYNNRDDTWIWAATGAKLATEPYAPVHKQWACVLWDPNNKDKWISESCMVPMPYICQTSAKPADKKVPSRKTSNTRSKTNPRLS